MRKKNFLMWAMAVMLTFMAGQTFAAQVEQKGAKIELEEESESPKLKFIDEIGKIKKEMSLKTKKIKGTVVEDRKEYTSGKFEVEFEAIKKIKLSPNSKYALMDNSTVEWRTLGGSTPNGKVVLYDINGNVLFEKKFPRGIGVLGYPAQQQMIVSDNGTVALITNDSDEGIGNLILHVYDKTSKERFIYPGSTTEGITIMLIEELMISPNGKYLSARVEFYNESVGFEPIVTVFFNTETKKYWKTDKDYNVYSLNDNGLAEISYKGSGGKKQIDLTQKIGEKP